MLSCYCKSRCWLTVAVVFAIPVFAIPSFLLAQAAPNSAPPLETPPSRASYGIGRSIGLQLAQDGLDADLLDVAALAQGIQDSLTQTESRVTQEEFQAAMSQVQQVARQRMQQKMQAVAERNQRDGPKFLAKYKALEGVKETPSGLLYKVLTPAPADAPSPKETDVVRTHYRGRLIDNTEFDSSYKRNQPAEFALNQVIPGWTEALQMMKVGDKWQLVIPSNLAYGKEGRPPVIGPDSVLVFEIELLGIGPEAEGIPQP